MHTSRTRPLAITAATLALVVAGTAIVAAHPGDREDPLGFGGGRMRQFDEWGNVFGDMRGQLRGMIGGAFDSFVRTDTTYQSEDGFVTRRVDNGTVATAGEAGLEYTLATGESASVSTDEDTQVIALSTETVEFGLRGLSRERLMPESIAVADLSAGSEVVVWALSQDDGTFLAQRIVVQPAADEVADEVPTTEDEAATEADTGT